MKSAWNRFFFAPTSTATLGVMRIAFGLTIVFWTVSLAPDLFDLFSRNGIVPFQPGYPGWIGLLEIFPSKTAVVVLFALLLIASVCFTIGYRSRLAGVVVFLGVLSFERRNPLVFNAGDDLIRIIALYLMLAPTGAALSVDRLRHGHDRSRRDRFWEFPARAPWALRLVQLQICVVYAGNVWSKLRGVRWSDGTAVSYALRIEDYARFPVPSLFTDSLPLVNLSTYAVLLIELALVIAVWNRRARPWVLIAGVLMHLSIEYALLVGFFGAAVFTGYLAFVPPETMERWLLTTVAGRARGASPPRTPLPQE